MTKRLISLCTVLVLLTGARGPSLVPGISKNEIEIQYSFSGAKLQLFGAIVSPAGQGNQARSDIAVVVKAPPRSVLVREKQKWFGIWVNAESSRFRSVPGFYAIASSRPIDKIVDRRTAAIYELGLDSLQLSPAGEQDVATQRRFDAGLADLMRRQGLFRNGQSSVEIREGALYVAEVSIPATVPTGTYTAETFLIQDRKVVAAATRTITVRKIGFERFVANSAEQVPFLYGLAATLLALGLGWLAGFVFRRA